MSVEYCQRPSVTGSARFSTMAIPLRAPETSGSATAGATSFETRSPGLLNGSSEIDARTGVAVQRGASFRPMTVSVTVAADDAAAVPSLTV